MKIKSIAISKLKLRYHPKLSELICHDHFELSTLINIRSLPAIRAQTLLDLSPVLACKNKECDSTDWQLNPNPILGLLKYHPNNDRLVASVHYYPESLIDDVLAGALLFAPAFNYRQQSKLLTNLFTRSQQAKALISNPPLNKVIAEWANVKPSAIRSVKYRDE